MRPLIVVAKDIGAANVTFPLAHELSGYFNIHTALEGRAVDIYAAAPQQFDPLSGDPAQTIAAIKPEAVICGSSFPRSELEMGYAAAANAAGIPLMVIEDFWGGASRVSAKPDIVGAMDEAGAHIARERYPGVRVVVSGNPGVRQKPLVPSQTVLDAIGDLRQQFKRVFVLVLGIEYDVANFFARCMALTPWPWCVIPRIHPKLVGHSMPSGHSYEQYFRETLNNMGGCVWALAGSTDEQAVCCDGVITGLSTVQLTALQAGVPTVSLWTPETAVIAKSSGGIDGHPLERLGLPLVRTPRDLTPYLGPPSTALKLALRPYDASVLARALREHIGY